MREHTLDSVVRRLVKVGARVVYHARKWSVLKLPKTGFFVLSLVFFIRIWEGFMGLQGVLRCFRAVDGPKMPFEIRWWSG